MTKQELFDHVVLALRRQGRPSLDEFGACVYRGPDGTRCAAGHVIPDERYDPRMEGSSIDVVCREWAGIIDHELFFLLVRLQLAHDASTEPGQAPSEWMRKFCERARAIAEQLNLSAAALDQEL